MFDPCVVAKRCDLSDVSQSHDMKQVLSPPSSSIEQGAR